MTEKSKGQEKLSKPGVFLCRFLLLLRKRATRSACITVHDQRNLRTLLHVQGTERSSGRDVLFDFKKEALNLDLRISLVSLSLSLSFSLIHPLSVFSLLASRMSATQNKCHPLENNNPRNAEKKDALPSKPSELSEGGPHCSLQQQVFFTDHCKLLTVRCDQCP